MLLFKRTEQISAYLHKQKEMGLSVGFVPTMGALHQGHLSLIERSQKENDITVCSIFVNPRQFNDKKDLEKYPRPVGHDIEMLTLAGNNVLFLPEVDDIYPPGINIGPDVDLTSLTTQLEGAFRPGHFDGVITVVYRLLDIIRPDRLYMGLKDFQQQRIIGEMISKLSLPATLIPCPSLRESDGLAMSSRNVRLSPEWRQKAPLLYETLTLTAEKLRTADPALLKEEAINKLNGAGFRPEYFEIRNQETLMPAIDIQADQKYVILVAAWAGDVRLIDNILV